VPDPADPPSGCRFHTRCPLVEPVCTEQDPALIDLAGGHLAACHVMARELAGAGSGARPNGNHEQTSSSHSTRG
jgi:hypothetical protein